MIKIIVTLCAITFVLSLPLDGGREKEVHILRNEREDFQDGSYRFAYETSDGQKREESGQVLQLKDQSSALSVTGSYSYIGPDGVLYKVDYVADENGFQPRGEHINAVDIFVPGLPPPVALPPNAINSLLG